MWSLSGRPTSGTGRGNSKSARGQITAEDTCLSGVHKLEIVYILCVSSRVFHGSLPSCTLWEGSKERETTAPPWEVREGHTGPKLAGAKRRLFLTEQRRVSSPCVGPYGRFPPQVGKQPVLAHPGAIWGPQGPVWQKEKKPPSLPVRGEFGGVKKKQVKGPGSLEASRAGSLRPAEPVVEGFFPGVNFPFFRGRFWGLGVTDGVRKAKFPGGKPFSRVSPPGSTKG